MAVPEWQLLSILLFLVEFPLRSPDGHLALPLIAASHTALGVATSEEEERGPQHQRTCTHTHLLFPAFS